MFDIDFHYVRTYEYMYTYTYYTLILNLIFEKYIGTVLMTTNCTCWLHLYRLISREEYTSILMCFM